MYGAGKSGRGGGGARGGGRHSRSSFPPQPPAQRTTAPSGLRSLGGGAAPRGCSSTASAPGKASSAAPSAEENFRLVKGPLAFASIIRLAPDLVDEMMRVDAQGGEVGIKFGSFGNIPAENVIKVGAKDFRFTWSGEAPDLCDIYNQRQSGDGGNGLLIESGCVQRKVNVQRVLDESTKNHVKMRSEEAERKQKSRKAIILDPANPSMKNQMKAMASVDANPWKSNFKQKKEPPFKKRKTEVPQAPPKTYHKTGPSMVTAVKGRSSASPLPSSPEQFSALASPSRAGVPAKGHTIADVTPAQELSKKSVLGLEKDISNKTASGTAPEKLGRKGKTGATTVDLQTMLITLLMENPKGMKLKALEKAIGDTVPNSGKRIEPIIKKIANYQAPGIYFLKPGVELENLKKPSFGSGSSPEETPRETTPIKDHYNQQPALEPSSAEKVVTHESEDQARSNTRLEELNSVEQIDTQAHTPDVSGDKRMSDNSEGQAASSSDSGSDSDSSDSDSSDSDSDSGAHRSKRKSRSPVGSDGGSSSDTDSDGSNSKQVSDEDVDILTTDDDKDSKPTLHTTEPAASIPCRTPEGGPDEQNGIYENHEGHTSDMYEIEKLFGEDEPEMAINAEPVNSNEGEIPVEGSNLFLSYDNQRLVAHEHQYSSYDERDGQNEEHLRQNQPRAEQSRQELSREEQCRQEQWSQDQSTEEQARQDQLRQEQWSKDQLRQEGWSQDQSTKELSGQGRSRQEQSDRKEKSHKGKNKRGSDVKHHDSGRVNKSKPGRKVQPPINQGRESQSLDEPYDISPEGTDKGSYKGASDRVLNISVVDGDVGSGLKNANENLGELTKFDETEEKPRKHADGMRHGSFHLHDGFTMLKDKVHRQGQGDDILTNDRRPLRNSSESGIGDKCSMPSESSYRKQEPVRKRKEGEVANSQIRSSPNDHTRNDGSRFPAVTDRGRILLRELSDLELGELREPSLVETVGAKKQFERNNSFKLSENKPGADNWSIESKGRPGGKTFVEPRKMTPPNLGTETPTYLENFAKGRTSEHHVEEFSRPENRVVQSQAQQLSRVGCSEPGTRFDRLTDESGKSRQSEAGARQENDEEHREAHKKSFVNVSQQQDTKRGKPSHLSKETKVQKTSKTTDSNDGQKDLMSMQINGNGLKRKEPSSDESSCPYSIYQKEGPELKGPIKDFPQYKEFVQEYSEKYDSYCSLNKILEQYSNDFHKLGRDLEVAKTRDMERYYDILGQLNDSYRQCGTRFKRLKKIFLVLHEELKSLKQRIKDFAVTYTKD